MTATVTASARCTTAATPSRRRSSSSWRPIARVVAVVNDSLGSTKVEPCAAAFPDRVFNVGIAEQNLVGVGAGLANGGRIPFVCGASPFLTGRALEQIKVDAAY